MEEYTRAGTAFTPREGSGDREVFHLRLHLHRRPADRAHRPRLHLGCPAQRKRRCLMGIDLSRLRRGNDHDRRPWHGAAFIVEALVLLVFLIASLAVIMQVIAGAHERSSKPTAWSERHHPRIERRRSVRGRSDQRQHGRRVRPRRRPAGTTRGADRRPRQERVRLERASWKPRANRVARFTPPTSTYLAAEKQPTR